MQKQVDGFIATFLSRYLCSYWRKSLNNKGLAGAILMELSMANYDLLIVKLHTSGFQHDVLKLLHSYLTKCWLRTKVNIF